MIEDKVCDTIDSHEGFLRYYSITHLLKITKTEQVKDVIVSESQTGGRAVVELLRV